MRSKCEADAHARSARSCAGWASRLAGAPASIVTETRTIASVRTGGRSLLRSHYGNNSAPGLKPRRPLPRDAHHALLASVFAADEAHGLGEVVGQRRQLAGAARQPFDRLELLGGRGGDRFRFLRGRMRPALRLLERPADRARPLADTVRQLRHPLARAGRAGRRFADPRQVLNPVRRPLHHLAQVAADALEQLCRAVQRAARVLRRLADVACLAPATSPACCASSVASRASALTRPAACAAPWLARRAEAATSSLDA